MFKISIILLGLILSPNVFSDDSLNGKIKDQAQEIYESIDADDASGEDLANKVQELQDQYGDGSSSDVGMSGKVDIEDAIGQINSRYMKMPLELVKKEVFDSTEKGFIKKSYTNHPKVLTFVAKMLKTDGALLDAYQITTNQDVLKKFGLFMLGTFVLSFILSKFLIRVGQSFFTRFKMILFKSLIIWSARIFLIVHFLGNGLSKTWQIFLGTFIF